MKINLKSPLFGVVIFLLLCGAWFFYDNGVEKEAVQQAPETNLVTIKNAYLVEEKQGKKNWELTADTMQVDAVQQINNLTGVKGKLFLENGNIVNISSDKGALHLKSKDVQLTGNVVVVTTQAEKLVAQDLRFTNVDSLITASGEVVITKPGVYAKADKAVADRGLEQIKLIGNALVRKGGE